MPTLYEKIKGDLIKRRDILKAGGINCIPSSFKRFRREFIGISQGTYYLVSGGPKSGKTQITNYMFIFNPLLYLYKHPNQLKLKIFYFPLEETPEAITLRFMSFLIYHLSKQRISPENLKSTDERFPLPDSILEIMESEEFQNIMKLYEETVQFYDERNATGIWKVIKSYADTHGETYYKTIRIKEKDDFGNINEVDRKVFDYYKPNDENEYVEIICDHVSLLSLERGLTLRECINKLSEYYVIFRNRYNYIPIAVHQQNKETLGLEAFKNNKIRPTVSTLADSSYTGRDCNLMLGITNPHSFEIPVYLGYDVKNRFKNNIRFLEIVINRNGNSNGICPLFFDGAVNVFWELPLPNSEEALEKVYDYMSKIRNPKAVMLLLSTFKNFKKHVKFNFNFRTLRFWKINKCKNT